MSYTHTDFHFYFVEKKTFFFYFSLWTSKKMFWNLLKNVWRTSTEFVQNRHRTNILIDKKIKNLYFFQKIRFFLDEQSRPVTILYKISLISRIDIKTKSCFWKFFNDVSFDVKFEQNMKKRQLIINFEIIVTYIHTKNIKLFFCRKNGVFFFIVK